MIQEFDLHIHTINSDGEFTTKQLVQKIRESNIKTFAIADHDSIKSIKDMKEIDLTGLNYIKAIEISSILDNKYKMHILGYNINEEDEQLLEIINNIKQKRIKRIYDIKYSLKEQYNIILKDEEIENVIKENNIPGRVHIAKLLVKNNYTKTVPEAFEKYLDDIELVVTGGESDYQARLLNYDWILDLRKQCIKKNVSFEFRQCGSHFVMNGKHYHLPTKDLSRLAKRANINYQRKR